MPYITISKKSKKIPDKKQKMLKELLLTLELHGCMKQAQAMNCETT